jgi:predicted nucleic acid-binding protein
VTGSAEATDVRNAFLAIRITRHSRTPLIDSIWAFRHNLTVYDAAYLALANVLDGDLG